MLRKLQVSVQDEEGHGQFETVPLHPQPSAVDLFIQSPRHKSLIQCVLFFNELHVKLYLLLISGPLKQSYKVCW